LTEIGTSADAPFAHEHPRTLTDELIKALREGRVTLPGQVAVIQEDKESPSLRWR